MKRCERHDVSVPDGEDCALCRKEMRDAQNVAYRAPRYVCEHGKDSGSCPFCRILRDQKAAEVRRMEQPEAQKTGGSVDYYKVLVETPISGGPAYTAESIDIIEALGMTFAEGEAFKAIWRTCTGRMGGAVKADTDALYNAEKVQFFGGRMVAAAKRKRT